VSLQLRVGARSDVGLVREGNEDSMFAGGQLVAVADGIGGAVAGEVASAATISALASLDREPAIDDPLAALAAAIHAANDQLRDLIAHDAALAGMGTTLTAMLWSHQRLALAQVGDSRAYLLRDSGLAQITRDQTFVQMLVDRGEISREDASSHPQRSVILNALDGRDDVEPQLSLRDVREGDRYLLCSDGLSDYVEESAVTAALTGDDPQAVADQLVELALAAGAPDNVTCIVADVVDDGDSAGTPPEPILGGAVTRRATPRPQGGADNDRHRSGSRAERRAASARGRSIGRRLAVVVGGVVVLVAAAVVATALYIRHQWYVAATGSTPGADVAVYHGVQGSVFGVDLSHLQGRTDVPVAALPQDEHDRVVDGIAAGSSSSAHQVVANLRHDACQLLVTARAPTAATTPAPAPLPAWCTS
jgi:protein phosphatase